MRWCLTLWNKFPFIVCFVCVSVGLSAATPSEEVVSLLMSEDEEKIHANKNAPKEEESEANKAPVIPQSKSYQVQAVVFHNPTQWTVWVDGKSYVAGQAKLSPSIQIKAVSGQSVEITEDDTVTLLFTGQSYQGKN